MEIKYKDGETMSFSDFLDIITHSKRMCDVNKVSIDNVPVILQIDRKEYAVFSIATGMGNPWKICIEQGKELKTIVPDKRTNVPFSEFWKSRGPSNFNVSGFVPSKEAGERLNRLVNVVLESDTHKSWLDYREYEPTRIQYKFSAEEFDVNKLHELTKDIGIINLEILYTCKKNN